MTSWRDLFLRRCAQATQLFSKNATKTVNRLQPHVQFDQTKNEPRTPLNMSTLPFDLLTAIMSTLN